MQENEPSVYETLVYDERSARKHLHGWLSYAFASEVFVVVSLTLFLPICLEQFARDNGVLLPEKTEPCYSKSTLPLEAGDGTQVAVGRCVVRIGGAWVDSASFSLYVYSISVALQALTVISVGGIADYPPHRKRALLAFAALGSVSAMLFLALPSSSPVWILSALLAIFANVGFGASVVAMNAYLPFLAKEDKQVVEMREEMRLSDNFQSQQAGSDDMEADVDDESALLNQHPELSEQKERYNTLVSQTTARISGTGIALGYFAGIVALIIIMIPVMKLKGSTFALRLAIFASGLWWAIFTIPASVWLPSTSNSHRDGDKPWRLGREVAAAWKRLGHMLKWKEVKRLTNTFLFLGAWFLLSDGFTTITSTALLFGKTQLNMSAGALILVGLLVNASGIAGALIWPRIQRFFQWSNKKVVIVLVILCSLIPFYGCLGFLPVFRSRTPSNANVSITAAHFGGLTSQGEMFALAVFFGTVYGAFQAYARALYAGLIPPAEAARWYALYSITDKSSSFVGPLVVGLIADATGNIRYAFFFLVGMIWVAIPLLGSVNVEKGREDARRYR